MMLRNKLILLAGDITIPVVGYFLWNWNLYFIFLFFFLDFLAYLTLYAFKYAKISMFRQIPLSKVTLATQLIVLLIGGLLIFYGYSFLFNTLQHTVYWKEAINFFMYEDMGFAQGYVLLPLIALTAWSTYKTEFLFQRVFEKITHKQLFLEYVTNSLAALGLLAFLFIWMQLGIQSTTVYFAIGMVMYIGYKLLLLFRK